MAIIDNLELYYKLDEESGAVLDAHASNDGTNNGATPNVSGKINTAYSFDGSNDYIAVPSLTTGADSSYSINIWFKTDGALAGTARLFNHNSGGSEFGFAVTTTNIDFFTNDGTNADYLNPIAASYVDSTWTMATIVWNAVTNTKYIYVNGVEKGSVEDADYVAPTSWTSVIGTKEGATTTENFKGSLDEVGIWSKALTSEEILELYNSGDGFEYPFYIPTPPVAEFSATPLTGIDSQLVTFTDLSTNTPTSWLWDFGDTTGSTEQNPEHTYTSGTYTVTLTATNADGSDDEIKTDYIFIDATPVPTFPTGTVGTAAIQTNYPNEEGLIAGTTKQTRNPNL